MQKQNFYLRLRVTKIHNQIWKILKICSRKIQIFFIVPEHPDVYYNIGKASNSTHFYQVNVHEDSQFYEL